MFTEGLDKSALRWVREVSFCCNPYYFSFGILFLLIFTLLSFGCGNFCNQLISLVKLLSLRLFIYIFGLI